MIVFEMNETITILLGTYNGEKYVSHQIKSIINQTYTNWRLLIRDDNSTDNTIAVVNKYQAQYPDKIKVIENNGSNRGSLYNFKTLLQAAAGANYIMFCDQDDEWIKNKIEITLSKMLELEKQYGANYPLLIFTNFQYVDEGMNVIESKKNFEINRIKNFGFPQLLVQNPVYGCTTLMNKSLADKVGIIPPQADFHDHWVALVAAAFGKLYYVKEKTVLYRQHQSNVSGNWNNDSFKKRIQRIIINRKNITEAKAKHRMLLCFKDKYGNGLRKSDEDALNNFLCFYSKKKLRCLVKCIINSVRSQTLTQSLLLYATIFFSKE